jgi:cation:H+ antiporter
LYLGYSIYIESRMPREHTAPYERGEAAAEILPPVQRLRDWRGILFSVTLVVGGIVMVFYGARILVDAAVGLARGLSVSESVIGLTVVAIGTTLPELVTSLAATLRRNIDVALGNVFGSCIYNVLGIGGLTGLIAPTMVPDTISHFGNPVMLLVAVLMFGMALTGRTISRREGGIMLGLYAGYILLTFQT